MCRVSSGGRALCRGVKSDEIVRTPTFDCPVAQELAFLAEIRPNLSDSFRYGILAMIKACR